MTAPEKLDLAAAQPVEMPTDDDERLMRLWLNAGRGAMIFCLWCVFVIPVLLTIEMRF